MDELKAEKGGTGKERRSREKRLQCICLVQHPTQSDGKTVSVGYVSITQQPNNTTQHPFYPSIDPRNVSLSLSIAYAFQKFTKPSTGRSSHAFANQWLHPWLHPSTDTFTSSFIQPSISRSTQPSLYPSIHPSTHLSTHTLSSASATVSSPDLVNPPLLVMFQFSTDGHSFLPVNNPEALRRLVPTSSQIFAHLIRHAQAGTLKALALFHWPSAN